MHEVPVGGDVHELPVRREVGVARRALDRDVGDDRVGVAVDHLDDLVAHVVVAVAGVDGRRRRDAQQRGERGRQQNRSQFMSLS